MVNNCSNYAIGRIANVYSEQTQCCLHAMYWNAKVYCHLPLIEKYNIKFEKSELCCIFCILSVKNIFL